MTLDSQRKYRDLLLLLQEYEHVAVAFSGGVDSSLLLYAACEALSKRNVIVVHGLSELVSEREADAAANLLNEYTLSSKQILKIALHPLMWQEFIANSDERCYFCKKRMYQTFKRVLEERDCPFLLDGSNVDDLKSHRPGFRAIHELDVKTPLLDIGLNKDDIRSLAKKFNLSNYDKRSNSCLATRIAKGRKIKKESLDLVEKCEDFLLRRDFSGCRVKPNADDVILELTGDDAVRLASSSARVEIIHFFETMGFLRVLIDLKPRL